MGAFVYQAVDAKGKQQKGVMEGDSARQIRHRLREKAGCHSQSRLRPQSKNRAVSLGVGLACR